jgi:hypothetical protein
VLNPVSAKYLDLSGIHANGHLDGYRPERHDENSPHVFFQIDEVGCEVELANGDSPRAHRLGSLTFRHDAILGKLVCGTMWEIVSMVQGQQYI